MTKRLNQAMTALTQSYFDGTLAKGNCASCAVGNMVAHAHGKRVKRLDTPVELEKYIDNSDWKKGFFTVTETGEQRIFESGLIHPSFLFCIAPTGYAPLELQKIEYAFETSTTINGTNYHLHTPEEIDADQLTGLYAVVEVLCELDNIADPQEYKAMFTLPVIT